MFCYVNGPGSSLAKASDVRCGGLKFDTHRVDYGQTIPSLWREKPPAIEGLRAPEHLAGHSIRSKKTPPSQRVNKTTCASPPEEAVNRKTKTNKRSYGQSPY